MTREEQIQNYAYNNCIAEDVDDTSYSLIVSAIEWADETMIEKACKWLLDGGYFVNNTETIDDFKQAMKK